MSHSIYLKATMYAFLSLLFFLTGCSCIYVFDLDLKEGYLVNGKTRLQCVRSCFGRIHLDKDWLLCHPYRTSCQEKYPRYYKIWRSHIEKLSVKEKRCGLSPFSDKQKDEEILRNLFHELSQNCDMLTESGTESLYQWATILGLEELAEELKSRAKTKFGRDLTFYQGRLEKIPNDGTTQFSRILYAVVYFDSGFREPLDIWINGELIDWIDPQGTTKVHLEAFNKYKVEIKKKDIIIDKLLIEPVHYGSDCYIFNVCDQMTYIIAHHNYSKVGIAPPDCNATMSTRFEGHFFNTGVDIELDEPVPNIIQMKIFNRTGFEHISRTSIRRN